MIAFLRHAKAFLPQETLKTLYTGIVEPHFCYCCSVRDCTGSTEINQLQKLQHRAARILTTGSFVTPSRLLIDMLGFKTIEQLITDDTKIMIFNSLHDVAPQSVVLSKNFNKGGSRHNHTHSLGVAQLQLLPYFQRWKHDNLV